MAPCVEWTDAFWYIFGLDGIELSHIKTSHRPKYISCCILKIRAPQQIFLCPFASSASYRCNTLYWRIVVEKPTAWQVTFFFPLASVVPLFPSFIFQCVKQLQVCCWCRLALEGCCVSMGTFMGKLLLVLLPPPDCPHAGICTCSGKADWRLKPVYFLVCGTGLQDWV